jgi:hypothetical protein
MHTPAFLYSLPWSSAAGLVVREVSEPFTVRASVPAVPTYAAPVAAAPVSAPTISGVDPFTLPTDELDQLFDLSQAIVSTVREIDRQTHRFLTMLAEFDARRGWELGGHAGCAEWLADATGMDRGTARERVRMARALVELPETSAAMAAGELSYSKVRALTRVATAESEGELLELAQEASAGELERLLRTRRRSDADEAEQEEMRHLARSFSLVPDLDGMIEVRGRLTPEQGAGSAREKERIAARRRADALVLLAERALEAGVGQRPEEVRSGASAERYQVFVHVGTGTLRGEPAAGCGCDCARGQGSPAFGAPAAPSANPDLDRSDIDPGIRVSAETSRRLTCDASVVEVSRSPSGELLDFGRRTRTIPPALRRALHLRDGRCRFPGCPSRFCEAHHITHWANGGATSLSNTLLLCRHHHRILHEGGWTLSLTREGHPVFRNPLGLMATDYRGTPITPVPRR